jgi:hypothetical protein
MSDEKRIEGVDRGSEVRLCCPNEKFGFAIDGSGTFRVRCRSTRCKKPGFYTYHYFDLATGALLPDDETRPTHVPSPSSAGATQTGVTPDA